MSYVPDATQLRGLPYVVASCFGMPHVGAYYASSSVKSNRLQHGAECAVCAESATNSHHEPQLGLGGRNRDYLLNTPEGAFVLHPALIALCGMGNASGCHGERHTGILRFKWEWDSDDYAEQWWSGYLLAHGFEPHDPALFQLGCWGVYRNELPIKKIRG